jgi:hypothetical protein
MFDLRLDRRGRIENASGESEFEYAFLIDLSHWSAEQYWASWRRSAAHLLEHSYGRFALSVNAPGGLYETWPCWSRDGVAVFHKSIVLPSITCDYTRAEECETPPEDYVERFQTRETVHYYACPLQDIADFERRLRKSELQ